ncbi:MAG: ATP-binding protein, partial [Polyangia bacterium]
YARRAPPDFTSVLVGDLFAEIRQLALTPGVTIEVVAAPSLAVRADATQLRRALLNLARNAVAAVTRAHPGGGGRVRLCAAADPETGAIALAIEDNGAGVEWALREKIFTPFFTTREKGTGLGLAFVREIVHDHGGEVQVDGAAGGGARFSFALPAATRPGATSGGGVATTPVQETT